MVNADKLVLLLFGNGNMIEQPLHKFIVLQVQVFGLLGLVGLVAEFYFILSDFNDLCVLDGTTANIPGQVFGHT